ncbi:TPA: bifunctional heptose 7-phosphate kinase/heptose 1-phosphate adenyltransferase [Streptococcus suis]
MLDILRKKNKILVVGDFMLDCYIKLVFTHYSEGQSVYSIKETTNTLGGAGNVLNQLVGAEQEVILLTRVGKDNAGENIVKILSKKKIMKDSILIYSSENIKTTIKYYSDINIKVEINDEKRNEEFEVFFQTAINNLDLSSLDAVIFSDYCKGVFDSNPKILKEIIKKINTFNIPIFVDSKRDDLSIFRGCTYIKSNLEEFCKQAQISNSDFDEKKILSMTSKYSIPNWIVTTSERGLIAVIQDEVYKLSSMANDIRSVVGAGDSFLSYLVVSTISKLEPSENLKIANIAAAIQVENAETYTVSLGEVYKRYDELSKKSINRKE